jgi:hypothetical protein
MTNIPQDIIDDAKEAGLIWEARGKLEGSIATPEMVDKFANLRDDRQRNSGEVKAWLVEGIDAYTNYERAVATAQANCRAIHNLYLAVPQQPHTPEGNMMDIRKDILKLDRFSYGNIGNYEFRQEVLRLLSATPTAPVATQSQEVMDALEAAAKVCEGVKPIMAGNYFTGQREQSDKCAKQIRALIPDTQAKKGE